MRNSRASEERDLEQEIKEMMEFFGGEEGIAKMDEAFHQVVLRWHSEEVALTKQYPYKWVAVGKDGLLEVGDSMEEVSEAVRARGIRNPHCVLRYLNPNPPPLIL